MVKCLILEACKVADVKDTEKQSNRTERWALELAAGNSRRRIIQHYSESPCCQTSVTDRTGEEMREKNNSERGQSLTNADFMGVHKVFASIKEAARAAVQIFTGVNDSKSILHSLVCF